jgi:hypothetical protein
VRRWTRGQNLPTLRSNSALQGLTGKTVSTSSCAYFAALASAPGVAVARDQFGAGEGDGIRMADRLRTFSTQVARDCEDKNAPRLCQFRDSVFFWLQV